MVCHDWMNRSRDICIFRCNKSADSAKNSEKIACFEHFECIYFVNGMSDIIKPTHFLKVLNEDFTIKQTVFKNIQVEKNDVISNMADFAIF